MAIFLVFIFVYLLAVIYLCFRENMNPEKLKPLQESVRTGGKVILHVLF